MSVAVDLVQYRLSVKLVVALDVRETVCPAIIVGRVWKGDRSAAAKRQSDRNGIDFWSVEIVDTAAAGTIGPFVRRDACRSRR